MGFRPRDAATAALAEHEAERVARRPGYRTAVATLRRLVRSNLFFQLDTRRNDVIGQIPADRIVLRATDLLAARFGSDRERGISTLADQAADRLGLRSWRALPAGERLCWERWAPLVALLPDLDGWSPDERHGLADVIRAKGGRRESDFVARFDTHPRLGPALVQLARG
jgi:hypothetical protein